MSRLRLLFGALAAALLLPVLAIVQQSTRALAAERAQEHEAVAARAFDEMQRALDELLAGEEARPPGEYKRYYVPTGESAVTRSPLADLPYPEYVVGYFELDQNREFRTPLVTTEGSQSFERGQRVAELRQLVTSGWPSDERVMTVAEGAGAEDDIRDWARAPGPPQKERARAGARSQAPSSTVALKGRVEVPVDETPGFLERLSQIGKERSYPPKKTAHRASWRPPRRTSTSKTSRSVGAWSRSDRPST